MDKNMKREMEKFIDAEVKLSQNLNTLSHFITSKRDKPIITYPSSPFNNHTINDNSRSAIRLPTYIKKFSGDPLGWQCFYDSFVEAIRHKKS